MAKRVKVLLIALVTFAPMFVGGPSLAASIPDTFGFAMNYPEDVEAWANAAGVSFDTALSRMNAREEFDDVLTAIARAPDTYTGAYFTQHAKTYTLHVVIKSGATPTVELPKSGIIDTKEEHAPRSLSELNQLRDAVIDSGLDYSLIEPNVAEGRLSIIVPSEADRDAALATFSDFADVRVGPRPRDVDCPDRYLCTPWRGGTEVLDSPQVIPNVQQCTWGYLARGNNDGQIKMLTAAHCDTNGPSATNWYHGRSTGGSLSLIGGHCTSGGCQPYHIGGYYDAEKVNGAGQTGSPYNRIYYSNATKSYAITGVKAYTTQANGDFVNLTGLISGTKAGQQIANNNAAWCSMWRGWTVCKNGVRVDTPMDFSDSGGPDYYAGKAMGFTSSVDFANGDTYYVFADINADALNVTICTTTAC